MGVPAFFRWLSIKYLNIIVDAVEERNREIDGVREPVDATKPNPNFQEFDNLYLDMNGIIHPCTHPEDRPAPETEEEMFVLICEYIDRLFSIVRPRKLLYMAIDGVAPRAKMNQQRSRRFRAAKEAEQKKEQILSVRKKLDEEGVPLPPLREDGHHFDSNCITPGTSFMGRLAEALREYIHKKLTSDVAWQSIKVILSDASAPGEGEHKIMDFIRRQKIETSHDPNTSHCLCGADADLIMLGLATHEVNFNILREEFVPNQPRACELCGLYGHELENCKGLARDEAGPDQVEPLKKGKNFIFIRLPVLRECLKVELVMPNLPFEYDFERAVDDWVFMCFFVGNDFLPHLPSLEIREGAIDRLVKLYKNVIYKMKGWLTDNGDVFLDRVHLVLTELGKEEDEIFRTRRIKEIRFRESKKKSRRRARAGINQSAFSRESSFNSLAYGSDSTPFNSPYIQPYMPVPQPGRYSYDSSFNGTTYYTPISSPYVQPFVSISSHGRYSCESNYDAVKKSPLFTPSNSSNTQSFTPMLSQLRQSSLLHGDQSVAAVTQFITHKGQKILSPEFVDFSTPPPPVPAQFLNNLPEEKTVQKNASSKVKTCNEASERLKAILSPLRTTAGTKRHARHDENPSNETPIKSFKDADGNRAARVIERNTISRDSDSEKELSDDDIRLWEDGWKDRYYKAKFGVSQNDAEFKQKVARAYADGLCWVMKYYYQGCVSWTWYFPYHYAPFASDFETIVDHKVDFSTETKPFKPLEQLMAVFPAASRAHIPECWRSLMTDALSPIISFYPTDFEIDLNGKKFAWQGVALLPFVDEKRLLDALSTVYDGLTAEEVERNSFGHDNLFFYSVSRGSSDEQILGSSPLREDHAGIGLVNEISSTSAASE